MVSIVNLTSGASSIDRLQSRNSKTAPDGSAGEAGTASASALQQQTVSKIEAFVQKAEESFGKQTHSTIYSKLGALVSSGAGKTPAPTGTNPTATVVTTETGTDPTPKGDAATGKVKGGVVDVLV